MKYCLPVGVCLVTVCEAFGVHNVNSKSASSRVAFVKSSSATALSADKAAGWYSNVQHRENCICATCAGTAHKANCVCSECAPKHNANCMCGTCGANHDVSCDCARCM
mmetsp:Transcript_11039/g.15545  ORF Transcript_11039/g.15545 Transcript_11039/m.15545 type:complete len:108 (-) Transcript_11039:775-1098(-)